MNIDQCLNQNDQGLSDNLEATPKNSQDTCDRSQTYQWVIST